MRRWHGEDRASAFQAVHDLVDLMGPPCEQSVYRMSDWLGRRVRLWGDITTRGVETFAAGTEMIVDGHCRADETSLPYHRRRVIRQVHQSEVELIG